MHRSSSVTACLAALLGGWLAAGLPGHAGIVPDGPNEVSFPATEARWVRFAILASAGGEPCLDELEVYGPQGARNLAASAAGAKAAASSCLPGYAIHQVAHLNDGLYGNDHSWIAAGTKGEWAQIELPGPVVVDRVVFSRDRLGRFRDRVPVQAEVRLSLDGEKWQTVARIDDRLENRPRAHGLARGRAPREEELLEYAFRLEAQSWQRVDPADPVTRTFRQMEELAQRLESRGLNVAAERRQLAELRDRQAAGKGAASPEGQRALLYAARLAKRELFLRDPDLETLQQILLVKRQPFWPSHNYSDLLDSEGGMGGAVCRLDFPWRDGRLRPGEARLTRLFDAGEGVARDPVASWDARRVYFAWKPAPEAYFHLVEIGADGSEPRTLTAGPFHDFYPCPLPDGALAFVSTRCRGRFLCWRPQAFVLFRREADGELQALSHANLSEWAPSVMRDGRVLWTRSEYLDKGADFGHTLWAIHPDGTHPELIFGNNTRFCYVNAREMPGTDELCCTLISHGGDLNGPLGLVRPSRGRQNEAAVVNLTPDVAPRFHMDWARSGCFRDPVPVGRDLVLCSHAPEECFGLYVVDRAGNREVLYLDPEIGSMCPTPLRPVTAPPVLAPTRTAPEDPGLGEFFVADVYQGLEPAVARGAVKYLRVCQELRSDLAPQPDGSFQADHPDFQEWYASPTHLLTGPSGWPSYVAKGVWGLAAVEADGSAHFQAPAGKVLYFQALDADFNELQRMRSVVQLQPGEKRSCVGCHEDRARTPSNLRPLAAGRPATPLEPPPWGAGPFAYERVVQPVWDAHCVRCHGPEDARQFNLAGTLDAQRVPASYRTLIAQGWVHYFDYTWGQEHRKAAPLTFGTLKSRLTPFLNPLHYGVRLSREELQRVKCWVDLNCPLWPDYTHRPERPAQVAGGPARP